MTARATHTYTSRLVAECQGCDWTTDAPNGLGNAAKHHDATGHTVRVDVDRTVVYGDPHAAPAGQDVLFPGDPSAA